MNAAIKRASGGIGGTITAPPSKSMAHRAVLCSALAEGASHIENLEFSKDISATLSAAGQLCANACHGHLDALRGIGSAAHNLQQLARAVVHLANAQAIGIGMLFNGGDQADHHVFESGRSRLDIFDLQAGHGELVAQFFGTQLGIHKAAQPRFGK